MMDSIKQTSFQGLQGELDSHMDTLSGQVRNHQAQQALSLHKVDMEASVMEVSCKWNQGSGAQECSQYSVPNYMCDTRCSNLTKLICKNRHFNKKLFVTEGMCKMSFNNVLKCNFYALVFYLSISIFCYFMLTIYILHLFCTQLLIIGKYYTLYI